MALKIKQFKSKYPFKQSVRPQGTLHDCHVNDLPEPLFSEIEDQLDEHTTYVIVYDDGK